MEKTALIPTICYERLSDGETFLLHYCPLWTDKMIDDAIAKYNAEHSNHRYFRDAQEAFFGN